MLPRKKDTTSFNIADLETFNSILLLTGYHSLLQTRMFWEKEDDTRLSIVYETMSRKEFDDLKSFADTNALCWY